MRGLIVFVILIQSMALSAQTDDVKAEQVDSVFRLCLTHPDKPSRKVYISRKDKVVLITKGEVQGIKRGKVSRIGKDRISLTLAGGRYSVPYSDIVQIKKKPEIAPLINALGWISLGYATLIALWDGQLNPGFAVAGTFFIVGGLKRKFDLTKGWEISREYHK